MVCPSPGAACLHPRHLNYFIRFLIELPITISIYEDDAGTGAFDAGRIAGRHFT